MRHFKLETAIQQQVATGASNLTGTELAALRKEYCADIDECALGHNNCGQNTTCVNHLGGFTCQCTDGNKRVNGERRVGCGGIA